MGSDRPTAEDLAALVNRTTAARFLGVSVRTISQLGAEGLLVRVARPGAGRKTLGYSRESLLRFARGEAGKGVPHADT